MAHKPLPPEIDPMLCGGLREPVAQAGSGAHCAQAAFLHPVAGAARWGNGRPGAVLRGVACVCPGAAFGTFRLPRRRAHREWAGALFGCNPGEKTI